MQICGMLQNVDILAYHLKVSHATGFCPVRFFASFIHFLRLDAAVFVVRPTQTEHLAFLAFLSLFLRIIKELFTARN